MVKEIRIYVEGGGEGKDTRGAFREGFSKFFGDIVTKIRNRQIRWQIVACGPRDRAYDDFDTASRSHPGALNILLVDSEDIVTETSPWDHLKKRDNWLVQGFGDEQCHLMVQVMEAWFLADKETLENFYGQGFAANALPPNPKVEEICKDDVLQGLKRATASTSKEEYHKTKHGPKILGMLDTEKVRAAAPYCDRLFTTLHEKISR